MKSFISSALFLLARNKNKLILQTEFRYNSPQRLRVWFSSLCLIDYSKWLVTSYDRLNWRWFSILYLVKRKIFNISLLFLAYFHFLLYIVCFLLLCRSKRWSNCIIDYQLAPWRYQHVFSLNTFISLRSLFCVWAPEQSISFQFRQQFV